MQPSSGSAAIGGYDVVDEKGDVYRQLGYCPQTSPLINRLTARETLAMYARLRGIPASRIYSLCEALIEQAT